MSLAPSKRESAGFYVHLSETNAETTKLGSFLVPLCSALSHGAFVRRSRVPHALRPMIFVCGAHTNASFVTSRSAALTSLVTWSSYMSVCRRGSNIARVSHRRVAQAFDLAGINNTGGGPSFAHFAKGGSGNVRTPGRTPVISAASLPALAKNARTGHPHLYYWRGNQNRKVCHPPRGTAATGVARIQWRLMSRCCFRSCDLNRNLQTD